MKETGGTQKNSKKLENAMDGVYVNFGGGRGGSTNGGSRIVFWERERERVMSQDGNQFTKASVQ